MNSRDALLLGVAIVATVGCGNDGSGIGSPTSTTSTSTTVAAGGSAGSGGSADATSTTTTGSSGSTGAGGSAGTAGAGGQGGGRPAGLPATESAADIGTFLKAGGYKMAPWVSDVAAPRPGAIGTQHEDNVRVWMNPAMVASLNAGHTGLMPAPPVDQWGMAVKEMYDDMSTLVGLAVSFKTAAGGATNAWTYYCYAPGERCMSGMTGTEAMPIYGKGDKTPGSACGFCHGFSVYTKPPM